MRYLIIILLLSITSCKSEKSYWCSDTEVRGSNSKWFGKGNKMEIIGKKDKYLRFEKITIPTKESFKNQFISFKEYPYEIINISFDADLKKGVIVLVPNKKNGNYGKITNIDFSCD